MLTAVTLVNEPVSQRTGNFNGPNGSLQSSTMFIDVDIPAGENRLVVVVMSQAGNPQSNFGAGFEDLSTANAMDRVARANAQGGTRAAIFVAPLGSGEAFTQEIAAGGTAANFLTATVYVFDGVSQTTPVDATAIGTRGSGGNAAAALSLNVTSESGDIVIDVITQNALFQGSPNLTVGPGQIEDRNGNFGQSNLDAGASHEDGANRVTMSWTSVGSDPWIAHAVANINQDRLPVVVGSGPYNVDENSAIDAVVGDFDANDGDGGATDHGMTYTILSGNTGNAFSINSSTGLITVNNPAALDFETTTTFNLTIEADDVGNKITQNVTINLNDLNESPVIGNGSFALPENSASGTVVGAITGTDVDAGQTLSYSITGGNTGNAFVIDSAGTITVNNPSALDFETNPTFILTVTATDNGSPVLATQASVTVNLTNVNEAPVLTQNANRVFVIEGQTARNAGTFADPESDEVTLTPDIGNLTQNSDGTWTWSLVTTDGPDDARNVTISARDSSGLVSSQTFELAVNNVAPTIALSGLNSVDEGSTYELTLGSVTDPGTDTVLQYVVYWGDGNTDIYNNAGLVSHTYADGSATRTISVDLIDEDGTHAAAGAKTISVNNVAPTFDAGHDETLSNSIGVFARNGISYTDPGADVISGMVNYGDGTSGQALSINQVQRSFNLFHTYAVEGTFTVTVSLTDGESSNVVDSFRVVVEFNTPPVAKDDNVSTREDTPVVINVLADNGSGADLDNENNLDASKTVNLSSPSAGVLTNHEDGTFTYDPNGEFETLAVGQTAQVSFNYRIEDTNGETDTGTVTITVTGVNDAPILANLISDMTVDEDADDVLIDLSNVFSDVDNGAQLTLSVSSGNSVLVNATVDGSTLRLNFLPDQSGVTTIIVTVIDQHGASVSTTFQLIVLSAQDQIVQLDDRVDALIASGDLSRGEGKALTSMLANSQKRLDNGQDNAGTNVLNAFINRLESLLASNRLGEDVANSMISDARRAIASARTSGELSDDEALTEAEIADEGLTTGREALHDLFTNFDELLLDDLMAV